VSFGSLSLSDIPAIDAGSPAFYRVGVG
jgi:hypothetical protein